MLPFMPKPSKTKPKQKIKPKLKGKELEVPGITTRKSYWIILTALLAVVSAVFGVVMGIGLIETAFLAVTIVVVIGTVGFIRVSPSTLSLSKRATFLFVGTSIVGFGIWAALTLTGVVAQAANELGEEFFVVTSLALCLTAGAFIGEIIGRNKSIQERLFSPKIDD
jgi:hypothetical protein